MLFVPPFGPLHAHVGVAHMGDDVNGENMWGLKNMVCDKPGQYNGKPLDKNNLPMNPTRHGSGRFHDVWQPEENMWGHCPAEETSSFMIDN